MHVIFQYTYHKGNIINILNVCSENEDVVKLYNEVLYLFVPKLIRIKYRGRIFTVMVPHCSNLYYNVTYTSIDEAGIVVRSLSLAKLLAHTLVYLILGMIIYLYISEQLVVGVRRQLEAADTEGPAPRRARLPVVQREQARHRVILLI